MNYLEKMHCVVAIGSTVHAVCYKSAEGRQKNGAREAEIPGATIKSYSGVLMAFGCLKVAASGLDPSTFLLLNLPKQYHWT